MKRKKSQKHTPKSRKKLATEKNIGKPQDVPVIKQSRKYASLDIALVNFKTPRRNVKPPKKYADQDFIYYNNTGSDEFGIDPSLLCECALDTSDPSVCENNQNAPKSTETASENGEDVADPSKLCEAFLASADPASSFTDNILSSNISNDNAAEIEDDYVDLSKLCQTQLITSDPNDPQTEIDHLVGAGNSEEEFILGISDGELDFASSIRIGEREVCQTKLDVTNELPLPKNLDKKETTRVPGKRIQKRRKTRPTSRRKKKQNNVKVQVQQANGTDIHTVSTANDDHLSQNEEKDCSENTLSKQVLVPKSDDDHPRLDKENLISKRSRRKKVQMPTSEDGQPKLDKENVILRKSSRKKVQVLRFNANSDKRARPKNIVENEVLVVQPRADHSRSNEEQPCPESIVNKDTLIENIVENTVSVTKSSDDYARSNEKLTCPKNILDIPVTKTRADNFKPEEDKNCPENIFNIDVLVPTAKANNSTPVEGKVCPENVLNKEVARAKTEADNFRCGEEMDCPENILLNGEIPVVKTEVNSSRLYKEEDCPENILNKEVSELKSEANFVKDSTTNADMDKPCTIDEKSKQPMAEKKVDECSVPDTDSGCDVDMEQCCEEDEQLNVGVPGEEGDPAANQVPYFNETRTVKVLLHRLEDEKFFDIWKEEKQLSTSEVPDSSIVQPAINVPDQRVSSEVNETVTKSKKSKKKKRRNSWENIKLKRKHVRCPNCNKKFPNELTMKKHQGSHTCVLLVQCRICYAKFKSIERLMEHKKSSCDTERVFACDVCGKSYALKQHLEKHQTPVCRSLKTNKSEICKKQLNSQSVLDKPMEVDRTGPKTKRYLCEICGALSASREVFQYHKEQHIENLKIVCKQCGKEFESSRKLRKHMKIHLPNASQYTCAECGTSFLEMSKLKSHLAVHGMITSLKQFECVVCQKVFDKSSSLKLHLQTHSVEEDYVCLKCTVPFNTQEDLKEHMTSCGVELKLKIKNETNLSIIEEKPHVCNVCGKLFSKIHYLARHSLVHLEQDPSLICDICGKKFKSNFHLSQHKLMISCNVSSTNYFCRECGNEYMNFPNLRTHFIEAHSVKTPVKCDKCGKEFENRKKLKYHMITHSDAYWSSCQYCGKVITKRSLAGHISTAHKSSPLEDTSGSPNQTSDVKVKVEPPTKKEEQPCLLNESGPLPTYSRLSEMPKRPSLLNEGGPLPTYSRLSEMPKRPSLLNEGGPLPTYSRFSEIPKPKPSLNNQCEKSLLPCRFCGKILGSKRSLKRHVVYVHKSSNVNDSLPRSSIPKAETPDIKIEEQTPIKDENNTVLPTECPVEDNTPAPINKTDQNSLSCPCTVCGKVLAHKNSLKRHMIGVHKVFPSVSSANNGVAPKSKSVFNVDEQPQPILESGNLSLYESKYNEIKANGLQRSNSSNNQELLLAEQQTSTHVTSTQESPRQSCESFDSTMNTSPQTEQQVPETPTSISGFSQNEYPSSEISNNSILMSQLINAQNYKMYLPNTSFLNSQCQNTEASSNIKSITENISSGTHEFIAQQSQQNHYPTLESASDLTPMAYLSHEVPTSNVHSVPISEFITPKSSETVKIPPINQYTTSETISSIDPTSLLEDKTLDSMIKSIICATPSVQAVVPDSLINIPTEETLTPQYNNIQANNANMHTAPSVSYNYFIAPGCPDIPGVLTNENNLTTQTLPLCYQSPEIPNTNFKMIQQKVPVVTSTNTYLLHQYVEPNPTQTASIKHYQSPGASNTYIIVQRKIEPESPRATNIIAPRTVSTSNEFSNKVQARGIEQQYKFENLSRKANIICNICKQYFYSKEELNKHLIVHGLDVTSTSYRCTTCDQSFDLKYKYRAEEHLRLHTGEKPFTCNICSQKFRTSSLLNKHSQTHSKPIVPKCSVCHVTFSSTYCLRRHLKTVHKIDTPPTQPPAAVAPIKKENSAKSFLENFTTKEHSPNQSEPVEPLPNLQQPYMSQEMSDFRESKELTSSHSYSYGFEESNDNHSDIALDLSDLRDDFVPDAMETVLKLENW